MTCLAARGVGLQSGERNTHAADLFLCILAALGIPELHHSESVVIEGAAISGTLVKFFFLLYVSVNFTDEYKIDRTCL